MSYLRAGKPLDGLIASNDGFQQGRCRPPFAATCQEIVAARQDPRFRDLFRYDAEGGWIRTDHIVPLESRFAIGNDGLTMTDLSMLQNEIRTRRGDYLAIWVTKGISDEVRVRVRVRGDHTQIRMQGSHTSIGGQSCGQSHTVGQVEIGDRNYDLRVRHCHDDVIHCLARGLKPSPSGDAFRRPKADDPRLKPGAWS